MPPDPQAEYLLPCLRSSPLESGDPDLSTRPILALTVLGWALGEPLAAKAQRLGGDLWYIEGCAAYAAMVDGAPSYRALLRAWETLHGFVGWTEVDTEHALRLGARLRKVPWGTRRGRNLILTTDQLSRLQDLARALPAASTWTPSEAPQEWIDVQPTHIPEPGKLVAICCPFHGDRHPSLILRRDSKGDWGTGICLSCGATVAVRFGEQVAVRRPVDERLPRPFGGLQQYLNRREGQGASLPDQEGQRASVPDRIPPVPGGATYLRGVLAGARLYPSKRSAGHALRGCPDDLDLLLLRDDARSMGPGAIRKAEEAREAADMASPEDVAEHAKTWIPVGLIAGCTQRPILREVTRRDGSTFWMSDGWEPVAQRWISFDLDRIEVPDGEDGDAVLAHAAEVLALEIPGRCPGFDGRLIVVRTGPDGVHVHLHLDEPRDPRELWEDPAARNWYGAVGALVLETVRASGASNGWVDPACFGPGRWWRRPGWRILPDGTMFRSRVVGAASLTRDVV